MNTYGGICWLPALKLWHTWKSGDMEKAFCNSALKPEKAELLRKTSRVTSFETFSTVPGFDRPRASRFAWKALMTLVMEETIGFS